MLKSSRPLATLMLSLGIASVAPSALAQSYDDYSDFAADPVLLDEEASEVFGRFFQNQLLVGTSVFTGGLGAANSAGFLLGTRFVFFFDKVWAVELGAAYGRHSTSYNPRNTNVDDIDILMTTHTIPFTLGMRYGFDQAQLPRGFATMNPYLAAGGELIYRSERTIGTPTTTGLPDEAKKFQQNDINNSNALGLNVGGGIEFDVYKNRMLLGFDLRYHLIFWPDASIRMGIPDQADSSGKIPAPLTRGGGYISVQGTLTYNY
jgi:opacity protein-like surface antigen